MALFGGPKSVSEIVAGLNKIITQLEDRGRVATEERGAKEVQITTLTTECGLLKLEEGKAGAIASNLRKLLDVDGDGEVDVDDVSA